MYHGKQENRVFGLVLFMVTVIHVVSVWIMIDRMTIPAFAVGLLVDGVTFLAMVQYGRWLWKPIGTRHAVRRLLLWELGFSVVVLVVCGVLFMPRLI